MRAFTEDMINSSQTSQRHGRFWEPDFDSECDELGEADALALEERLPSTSTSASAWPWGTPELEPVKTPSSTPTTTPPAIFKSSPSPRRIRAPLKSWRGPLPPRRITSPVTVGDYVLSALSSRHRDLPFTEVQILKPRVSEPAGPVGPVRSPAPRADGEDRIVAFPLHQADRHEGKPKRKLVNPNLFLALPLAYRDVLMAGGSHGRFRGRHGPGRGAPAVHRRGRGAATGGSEEALAGTSAGRGRGAATDRRGAASLAGRGGAPPTGAAAGGGRRLATLLVLIKVALMGCRWPERKERKEAVCVNMVEVAIILPLI